MNKIRNIKHILLFLAFIKGFGLSAQTTSTSNKAAVDFERGLLLTFSDSNYAFQFGGFIQPSVIYQKNSGETPDLMLNAKRTFLRMGGIAVKEKLSFLIQMDFSQNQPLLDAWIAYHPGNLTLTFGQKQSIGNNREMLYREDRLQFADRSILSEQFSQTGREFGLFAEWRLGKKIGIEPKLAITSGDGRNSFGADSRDVDLGGLKYAGRLDIYPLGFFKSGNDLFSGDLLRENKPKFVLGSAFSVNQGASNKVGEGHGDFSLYNEIGKMDLPNYRKFYVDLLAKYNGFSFLFEFGNASAAGLSQNFLDDQAALRLAPGQISTLMILGNSYNSQLGFITKSRYGFDLRYASTQPEFEGLANNLITKNERLTLGISKYLQGHQAKIQSAFGLLNPGKSNSGVLFELMAQVGF